MRQRACWYVCDGNDGNCGEESDPRSSFTEARKVAQKLGWLIEPTAEGEHYCPEHRVSSPLVPEEETP